MNKKTWHDLLKGNFSAGETKMMVSSIEIVEEVAGTYGFATQPEVKMVAKVGLMSLNGKQVVIEGDAQLVYDILERLK